MQVNDEDRIYENSGNQPLLDLHNFNGEKILDVGCGAGDNASLLKRRYSQCQVFGITYSEAEAEMAQHYMEQCWVFNIEGEDDFPQELKSQKFDTLIFSHILEHLREPATVLARFTQLLKLEGAILIAVPNILNWRQRIQFLFGDFEYTSAGILDDTHLRFFTYNIASNYLLTKIPKPEIQYEGVSGSVPLWIFRRYLLPKQWSAKIDLWGCQYWPNLFGGQILIKVIKNGN